MDIAGKMMYKLSPMDAGAANPIYFSAGAAALAFSKARMKLVPSPNWEATSIEAW